MQERAQRISVEFDNEQDAASALEDARRRFPGKVHASVEDPVDRGAGGARRRQEAQDVIVGPSYAMTNEQAKRGALGMVVGAAVLGVLTAIVVVPMALNESLSLTTAVLIVLTALMGGGTIGVIMGGRSGGIKEEERDERDEQEHQRRVVVQIDTATPGEAAAARAMLDAHQGENAPKPKPKAVGDGMGGQRGDRPLGPVDGAERERHGETR